jgi:hypothetical protein
MERVSTVIGTAVVLAAALYLLTLGGGALIRPESTKRFLGGFATTPRIHFTELALRVLTGAALVATAPQMAFGQGIAIFGWMLIATSLVLGVVPWRQHQRFAAWAVPQATKQMALIGVASIFGGIFLLAALLLPLTTA